MSPAAPSRSRVPACADDRKFRKAAQQLGAAIEWLNQSSRVVRPVGREPLRHVLRSALADREVERDEKSAA